MCVERASRWNWGSRAGLFIAFPAVLGVLLGLVLHACLPSRLAASARGSRARGHEGPAAWVRPPGRERRAERGAAAVETALVLTFVVLPVVFAIISYAYMLSFRQTVSQSAAEGARAAAVAPSSTSTADRITAAQNAVNQAMSSTPGAMTCGTKNLTCTITKVANCGDGSSHDCMQVTVSYPYRDHSLLPSVPGLGFVLPSTISYTAVAETS